MPYRNAPYFVLVCIAVIAAQMRPMGLSADNTLLETLVMMLAQVPSAAVWMTGFAIGAATSWAGWNAGKRTAVPVAAAQAA